MWFRTDDGFHRHRKVRRLGKDKLPAVGLWELSGNWAADNIDSNVADGFVPWEVIEAFGDTRRRYARRLIDVGLWEAVEVDGESGVLFHDWADSNPTKEDRRAEREAWRTRKALQRGGSQDRMSHRDTLGTPPETHAESPPETPQGSPTGSHADVRYPDPTRPVEGHLGGIGPAGDRATGQRPPSRCPRHLDDPDPPPCGPCGDARRAADRWDTEQAEHAQRQRRAEGAARSAEARARADTRRRGIDACGLCDADGYRAGQVCDHDPHAADRARRGRDAVQAALAAARDRPEETP